MVEYIMISGTTYIVRPPVEREPIATSPACECGNPSCEWLGGTPITIADLEAKIQRMREEDRGRPMVAAIDAIHDRRKRMLEWPEVK